MTKRLNLLAAAAALMLSGGAAMANQDWCPYTNSWVPPGTCAPVENPPSTPSTGDVTQNVSQTANQSQEQSQGQGQSQSQTGGTVGDTTGGTVGDTTGGTASTTSGPATTSSGNIDNSSTATGGKATGGKATGGSVRGSGNSRSTSGSNSRSNSGGNVMRGGDTNVDASSSYREAANGVTVGGVAYTGNPCAVGGGFGGSTIGATAGGNMTALDKACANKMQDNQTIDRVCRYLTIAECRATIAYLEPQARAGMVAAGTIRERVPGSVVSVSRHEQGDGSFTSEMNRAVTKGRTLACPDGLVLAERNGTATGYACVAPQQPSPKVTMVAPVKCPEGSSWDGRGCWKPRR